MIDICYVISHGFAARMLMQTNLLKKLAQQGHRIGVITQDASDPNIQSLEKEENIFIYPTNISLSIWDDDYLFKRMYYLEDISSNTVFQEKHIYQIKYSKSKHPWKRIRPLYYMAKRKMMKYFPSIRQRFKKNEGKYLDTPKADELLSKMNPKVLVSTYPVNFLEAKFLHAARKKNIETIIHLLSWDNITSKGIFPVIPDRFIAWGNVMRDELIEYYKFSEDKIHVCGVPHFDQHIQIKENPVFNSILKNMKLNPDQPYLFVAMSSPRFASREIDIVEWLGKQVTDNAFGPTMQLVVRPHPQNVQTKMADKSWIKRLDDMSNERVAIDYPQLNNSRVRWSMKKSDMNHLSNLLAGCSLCINSGSTVSIDALLMDKPVIVTAFDADVKLNYWKSARRLIDYTHQKKFLNLGGARPVASFEDLAEWIKKYLNDPSIDQERRRHALNQEVWQPDGHATDRVIETMNQILTMSDDKVATI